jgi:hypothetical protein
MEKIKNLLLERKEAIETRWLQKIVESYPDRTAAFLTQKRNEFTNPVGHILTSMTDEILQKFLEGADLEELRNPLFEIVKIRSVQGFSPSQAISFVYLLKEAVRESLAEGPTDLGSWEELLEIEDRVDRLACFTFDLYMQSREKIYELRLNEIKRTGFRLLQKAELISAENDPELL